MRNSEPRNSNESKQPMPSFRNTKSKFYQKKPSSFEQNTYFQENEKNTGSYWKQQGNKSFKKHDYLTAIQQYTKAINKNPSESVYFSNRAKCYKELNNYTQALKDAEEACELDPHNIKANYLCGCVLAELGKQDHNKLQKAQNRLKKALRLCKTLKKQQFQEEISIRMYRLKKLVWYVEKNNELQDLIWQKKQFNHQNSAHSKIIQRLDKKITKIMEFEQSKQIPDYLCCRITLELLEEPVTTQQGLTYQKQALQDHFKTNGFTQPISRKKLTSRPYPNLSLKQAVSDFLQHNPWAFEQNQCQNHYQIQF